MVRKGEQRMGLREDANTIIRTVISEVLPDAAVKKALRETSLGTGKLILIAAGKAAWQMASAAAEELGSRICSGVVITKYGHSNGPIADFQIYEAGHPVPDHNSFQATEAAIKAVENLRPEDAVLFLLSGGGSALFEVPKVSGGELSRVTKQLLASGADIVEMNTIRKRLSRVKGGRFAQLCAPAKVIQIVLSDIIGDPLDMIASGPAYPDSSTCLQAEEIARKYHLEMSEAGWACLRQETPKVLGNVESHITGSVRELCAAGERICRTLGYEPFTLTASLCCEARQAGTFLANIAQYYNGSDRSLAYLAGGETVVHLTGSGLGGRNQEIALSAAIGLEGLNDTAVFSVGSDGTDGPTEAAGGYVDQDTARILREKGLRICRILDNNDAYHGLEQCGGLIFTGATGTNVNDLSVLLIRRKSKE